MADELKIIFETGISDMMGFVLKPDGTERDFGAGDGGIAMTEVSSACPFSMYLGDCPTIVPADTIACFYNGNANFAGAEVYKASLAGGGFSMLTPAGYIGDYEQRETVHFLWRSEGSFSVNGTIRVYKNDGAGQVTDPKGISDNRSFDSGDGLSNICLCSIDLSVNTFYKAGNDYIVVLTGATLNGQPVDGVLASFSIENRFQGLQWQIAK